MMITIIARLPCHRQRALSHTAAILKFRVLTQKPHPSSTEITQTLHSQTLCNEPQLYKHTVDIALATDSRCYIERRIHSITAQTRMATNK